MNPTRIAAPAASQLPAARPASSICGRPGQTDSGALFALAFAAADDMAHDAGQPLAAATDKAADAASDRTSAESSPSAPETDTPSASAGSEAPVHLPPQPAPAASAADAPNTPDTAAEAPDAAGRGVPYGSAAAQEMVQEMAQERADGVPHPAPDQAPRHTPNPTPNYTSGLPASSLPPGQTPKPNSGAQAPGAKHPPPAAVLPPNRARTFGQATAAPENPAPGLAAAPLMPASPPATPPGAGAAENAALAEALSAALDFAPADAPLSAASAAHPGTHAAASAPAQAPLPAAAPAAPAAHTPAPSAAPSSATAQATVWLHGKNHSAALSLDDGAQPLQVHVRVQGSATHIHFASAQAHTRQWLDSSAGQLRELLGSQGLHLSAFSVSAEHSGGAQGSPAHGSAQHTPHHSADSAGNTDSAARPAENRNPPAAHTRAARLPARATRVDFFA